MKLETLKQVCDKVVGLESKIYHSNDSENGDLVSLRYRSEFGAFLFDVPIGEHNPSGWHLQGKVETHADSLYDSLHRAYRSERMKEVADIQRNRGFVKSEGEKKFLTDRIKRLEGALRVVRNWMGRPFEEEEVGEENALERDTAFVEHTLDHSAEYVLEDKE